MLLCAAGTGWALAVSWRADRDVVAPVVLVVGLAVFFFAYLRIRAHCDAPPRPDAPPDARGVRQASSNTVQFATALVSVPALVLEPRYLLVLVPLVLLSRIYYRARFGLRYPGPAGPPADA